MAQGVAIALAVVLLVLFQVGWPFRAGIADRLIGAYAIAAISDQEPGTLVAARKDSPLVVGLAEDGAHVASDIIAMIDDTRDVVVLGRRRYGELTPNAVTFYNVRGEAYEPEVTHVDWDLDVAEKGGYPDFMLKEIHEQPEVLKKTILPRLTKGLPDLSDEKIPDELLKRITNIRVIACGTADACGNGGESSLSHASEFR